MINMIDRVTDQGFFFLRTSFPTIRGWMIIHKTPDMTAHVAAVLLSVVGSRSVAAAAAAVELSL